MSKSTEGTASAKASDGSIPGLIEKSKEASTAGAENPEREGWKRGVETKWKLNRHINLRAVVRRLAFSVSKMNFPWGV